MLGRALFVTAVAAIMVSYLVIGVVDSSMSLGSRAILKAAPILLLGTSAAASSVAVSLREATKYSLLIGVGLLFSAGGDVALQLDDADESFFIVGLASFLVGHLTYIAAFLSSGVRFGGPRLVYTVPIILHGIVLLAVLGPKVETALLGPVIVYALTIATMVVCSILWSPQLPSAGEAAAVVAAGSWSAWLSPRAILAAHPQPTAVLGAATFLVSDSILAINKFIYNGNLANAQFAVMITYYVAQILLEHSAWVFRRQVAAEKRD